MQGSFNRILTGVLVMVITLIVAVVGYIEFGWTPLEAIYMVLSIVEPLMNVPDLLYFPRP